MRATLLLSLALVSACATPGPQPPTEARPSAATANPKEKVLAALYRGPCLGRCPEYQVVVFESGEVRYTGQRNVAVLGQAQARLSPAQLEALQRLFTEANFGAFAPRYEHLDTSDLPLVIISFGEKLVRHAHGDSGAPPELKALEDGFDRVVNSAQWLTGPDR